VISVPSVDYCDRCRCKTLHVPTPSGERVCEWHLLHVPEVPTPPAPAHETEGARSAK
jgi:hypothetical protein